MTPEAASTTPRLFRWPAILAGAAVATAGVVLWTFDRPPDGYVEQDRLTVAGAAVFGLLSLLSALGTAANLAGILLSRRNLSGEHRWALTQAEISQLSRAAWWAAAWSVAAAVQTPLAGAVSSGVPVGYVFIDFGSFMFGSQTTPTWLVTALGAAGVSAAGFLARTWPAVVVAFGATAALALPSVVTAQVSVGADHDLATDVMVVGTIAQVIWFATVIASRQLAEPAGKVANRAQRILLRSAVVAIGCRIFVAWFELAGTAPWQSSYGIFLTVMIGIMIIIAGLPRLAGHWGKQLAAGLIVVVLGFQVALLALFSPRARIPQTAQENFLGYEVAIPPQAWNWAVPGRPNLLLAAISMAAIIWYVGAYRKLRQSGHKWPGGRVVAWVIGWSILLLLSVTALWQYGSTMFSAHMIVHMTLNVIAPVLLVLGGPLTLALRVWAPGPRAGLSSRRDLLEGVLAWPPGQRLAHPLLTWLIMVGSFYAIYFSPIFVPAMKYHWAHQLMTFHMLIIGYLFFAAVIGVDKPPRPLPHIAKLGFVFSAMPFHAFFAVIVMMGALIGTDFFLALDLAWAPNLEADQQLAGGIAWVIGEAPLLTVVLVLLAQWWRSDRREATRRDRAMDAGHDDAHEAYQEMLRSLAERDAQHQRGRRPGEGAGRS